MDFLIKNWRFGSKFQWDEIDLEGFSYTIPYLVDETVWDIEFVWFMVSFTPSSHETVKQPLFIPREMCWHTHGSESF